MEVIGDQPAAVAETVMINLIHHSYKNITVLNTLHVGIFTIIGIIFFKKRKTTLHRSAYYMVNLSFFLLLLPFFYDSRFPLFLIPFFTMFAYYGIMTVADMSQLSKSVIIAGLLCFGIVSSINYNGFLIRGQNEVKKTAEIFLANKYTSARKEIIASRMPHISYELNMRWVPLPAGKNIIQTIAELKKKKVKYLYFSRREYNERKQLRQLIFPLTTQQNLTPVVYFPEGPAVLYKIN